MSLKAEVEVGMGTVTDVEVGSAVGGEVVQPDTQSKLAVKIIMLTNKAIRFLFIF